MLAPSDLQTLTGWCRDRAMCWTALRVTAEAAVLLLEPLVAARPWQRMRLIATDQGYLLENEAGQALASASDLPALLDALDGGIADAPAVVLLNPPHTAVKERLPAFA